MTPRLFLALLPVLATLIIATPIGARGEIQEIQATGQPAPRLAAFDALVTRLLQKYEVPGAALAVVKNGHLVLARGYGLADVERNEAVQPDSLFRIASLSKPFTSAAILT